MKHFPFIFFVLTLLLPGCQSETPFVVKERDVGGKFSLQWSGVAGGVIDFGPIRNTTSFTLLVSNAGNRPITNITVSHTNPAFIIRPTLIDSLAPGGSLASSRNVGVTAIHGTQASLIGAAPLMSPGPNYDTLIIAGTTVDAQNLSKGVQLLMVVMVEALIGDVRLFDSTAEIDLSTPSAISTGSGLTREEVWIYPVTHPQCTVRNSGNVALTLTSYFGLTKLHERTLQPNQSDTVRNPSTLKIDTHGTVTNPSRLHIGSDGFAFIGIGS